MAIADTAGHITAQSSPRTSKRHTRRAALFARTATVHIAVFAAIIGLWELVIRAELVSTILMPRPAGVLRSLVDSIEQIITGGSMRDHLQTTLTEVGLGLLIAIVVGVALGWLLSEFKWTRIALTPYVVAFNSTPRIALAPIFLVWFGFGIEAKVMMAAATATFPILIGTQAGLAATNEETLRLLRAYGATRWQVFRKVRIFDALPYMFAGLETAVVLAVIGAVVGEFMGGSSGLGYVVLVAQESLNLELAFASLLLLSLLGMALFRIVVAIRKRAVYWRATE